jgi:hypothetical protein
MNIFWKSLETLSRVCKNSINERLFEERKMECMKSNSRILLSQTCVDSLLVARKVDSIVDLLQAWFLFEVYLLVMT